MDVSDIFYFFLLGGGEGESEVPGGGGGFFLWKIPGGGGVFQVGGGRGARVRRVFAGNLGRGLNVFFRGRNSHQGKY